MFTVALLSIAFVAYWLRKTRRKATEPPLHPGAWPILGHMPWFFGISSDLWVQVNEKIKVVYDLGGVTSYMFGPRTAYGVCDPEDCATVANLCLEKDRMYNFGRPWLGDGLLTAKYATWKYHRKVLNPAFSQIVLDTFMGVFNNQAGKLVRDFEKEVGKGLFDQWTYTRLNNLETICLTALGVDFTDPNLSNKYVRTLELVFNTFLERFMKPWWHSRHTFAWSSVKKEQDAYLKILHNVSYTVLQKRKTEFTGNTCAERSIIPGTKFKAFVDILLEMSAEKGVFTDQQIREHVDTILVGGHDTTANVLTFTMIFVGSYPEVQEKVFAEIQEVMGGDRDLLKTDLSKLVYLEAVLKESMRIYTIVPIVARRLGEDIKLKNWTLSAHRSCILFLYGLHRHPVWGPDAEEFKPERWLEPGRLPDNPNAFAAFGLGKRQCIGKIYALMSMKTTLVHVLRKYRIKADHTKLKLKMDVMLKPSSGYYISIESRRSGMGACQWLRD